MHIKFKEHKDFKQNFLFLTGIVYRMGFGVNWNCVKCDLLDVNADFNTMYMKYTKYTKVY